MAFTLMPEKRFIRRDCLSSEKCILHCPKKWTEIVFLCIGSDRVTGDCLGPYIGHLLHPHETGHIFVYGTLSCPVHALNLEKTSSLITSFITRPCNRHRCFSWTKKHLAM